MSVPSKSTRLGSALRKLLTMLCGVVLFLVMVGLLGVWALGRFSPKLLDSSLATKSGAHLAVESNDTNLFAGRLAYAGLTITNPTRWTEKEFLKVRRLAIDLDLLTFFKGGSQVFHDVELDIEHLTIVGKADFLKDNNAKDIFNGLKSAVATEAPKPTPGPPSTKQPFLIKHLRVRVNRITIIWATAPTSVRWSSTKPSTTFSKPAISPSATLTRKSPARWARRLCRPPSSNSLNSSSTSPASASANL